MSLLFCPDTYLCCCSQVHLEYGNSPAVEVQSECQNSISRTLSLLPIPRCTLLICLESPCQYGLEKKMAITSALSLRHISLYLIDSRQFGQCKNEIHILVLLLSTLTLAYGGSLIIPLLVHQLAYLSIWPAAPSLQQGLSTNPGVTVWCVCGCS